MPVANFFWALSPISLYDEFCIRSFVKNGFNVNLYSYDKKINIDGVDVLDANEIINIKEIDKYNFSGYKKSPFSGLSNEFRYKLMRDKKGWWFDTDVFCLANVNQFVNLDTNNTKFIAGFEKDRSVNVAVLKINDEKIIHDLLSELKFKKKKLNWGDLGPKLFTDVLIKNNSINEAKQKNLFYSINYENFMLPLLPSKNLDTKNLLRNSLVCHLYNEIQKRHGIPKNIPPPKGSFLYEKFQEIEPELERFEKFCLPQHTAEILLKVRINSSIKEDISNLIFNFKKKWRPD